MRGVVTRNTEIA